MALIRTLMRVLPQIPMYASRWSQAFNAEKARDWAKVVDALRDLHSRELATDESRFRLGCALSKLGQWEEALSEFEDLEVIQWARYLEL